MGLFDWLSPKKKEVSIQEMRNLTDKNGLLTIPKITEYLVRV